MSIAYLLLAAASVHANTPEDVAVQALHNFGKCVVELIAAFDRRASAAISIKWIDRSTLDLDSLVNAISLPISVKSGSASVCQLKPKQFGCF